MMANRKRYIASRDSIVALKKEDKLEEAQQVLTQRFTPDGKAYLQSLSSLLELQRKSIDANAASIEEVYKSSRRFMIVFGLVVLALGIVCAWRLTRGITVPLSKAVDIAVAVANKDLTSHIEVTSRTRPAACWKRCKR
jgi:methyl-accepting chemotaxis protein